ncbi:MAG: hypothetical protein DME80_13035 [Verrucomicrobia bacterium]|nr:MAG: hypothetical protein DME80_13035 [Verrucomicrobiota bacterium]
MAAMSVAKTENCFIKLKQLNATASAWLGRLASIYSDCIAHPVSKSPKLFELWLTSPDFIGVFKPFIGVII